MSEYVTVQEIEERKTEIVYWIGTTEDPKRFGITFTDNPFHNIAHQSKVESILFAMSSLESTRSGV